MKKNLALTLCILVAVLAAWSCTVSDPEEKHLISILVPDSLKSFDKTRILLLDPVTRDTLDTLWSDRLSDPGQLSGLETKRYTGGPVEVVIEGWRSGELALVILVRYQADGVKPKTETLFIKPLPVVPAVPSVPVDSVKTVRDTVQPVLTLTGPDSLKVERGRHYVDLGAHCKDERDGDMPVIRTGAVDEAALGIHTLRYECSDSAGNKASAVTRRVHVIREPDAIPPILAITGPDTVESGEGREYKDPGAACQDDRDGNLPVTEAGDSVDVAARGEYRRSYACSDSAGNAAQGKTRIIRIVRLADPVKPVLTLRGRDSLEVWQGIPYSDSGAVCEDDRDGNLPVTLEGAVDVQVRGAHNLRYRCADSAGNTAKEGVRRVIVIRPPDAIPPLLDVKGPDTAIAIENRPYSDSGATCRDDRDGNVPVTVGGAVDILTRGLYTLTFGCADSAGNAAAARTRIVKVVRLPDADKPLLFMRGPDSLIVYDKEAYADSGAVCMDDRDGLIPVLIQGSVDTGRRARYILSFQCADSSGNTAAQRQRVVKVERKPDPVEPILSLRGDDSLDLHQGLPYQDAGSDCIDDRDGMIAASVTGSVDAAARGLYTLYFHCRDSAGNEAAAKIRKVKVIRVPDAVKPVLALAGPEAMEHLSGTPYVDSGSVCVDDRDGTLPVIVNGSVDPSAVATYVLEFACSDSAGNAAPRLKRTVKVALPPDSVKPVLTLVGPDTLVTVNLDSLDNPGAACVDDRDGALAATFKGFEPPPGPSGAPKDGIYRAVYECEDKSGNRAAIGRVVKSGMYTVNLSAIRDTQIDTLETGNNWGYTGVIAFSLQAWDNYFTFAKFDLTQVVKTGLKSAKLHYFTWGLGDTWPAQRGDYTFHIYALQSAWVEGTGNWFYNGGGVTNGGGDWLVHYHYPNWVKTGSTVPTASTGVTGAQTDLVRDRNITPLGTQKLNLNYGGHSAVPVVAPNRLVVVEVDVTEYVRNAVPAQDHGFMLKTEGTPGGRRIGWLTREMDEGQWAPRLMLSY